ncbi:MAG: rubrerythrin family protein [Candidatus Lokiarchaeota archaeon]|nr:rubrerythrin family protein [Candidatus Lokiarchaeota archaeon]MBD3198657.1 rubrerythrin family protein [Candidatus Lokiarchaeota archaeon]
MSKTIENLKEALHGESLAKFKYELYSDKAEQENLLEIANLFRAIAFAESIHIKNHLRALSVILGSEIILEDIISIDKKEVKSKISSTNKNLKDAINGEIYETKKMYKNFEKYAKKENSDVAELSFSLAREAEGIHAELFSNYLSKLQDNENFDSVNIYVCQICGNVELMTVPTTCPVCDHNDKFFKKVE